MRKATFKQYYRAGAIIAVVLAAIPLFNAAHSSFAASTSTLSLSPSSQTVTTGSNVVVSVVLTTNGDSINSVQSQFTYSTAHYSYVSIAPGASLTNFATPLISTSTGVIQFSAGTPNGAPPINGTTTVATITLHSTGTGTSALGLGAACGVNVFTNPACSIAFDSSSDNNDLSSVSGVSYTINAAPVTPPPTTPPATPPSTPSTPSSGGSGKSSTGGSTSHSSGSTSTGSSTSGSTTPDNTSASATPTTTATNPAPVISAISVGNVTDSSVTVSWTTNLPSTSVVNYGTDTSYGLIAQDSTLTTSHQVTVGSPDLAQGTHYFFKVSSATATGASSTSSSQQFTTLGYSITIRVVDAQGKLVKGAKVFLDGQTATTNSDGVATLHNVLGGNQAVTIKIGNKVTRRNINVNGNTSSGSTKLQQFSLSAVRGTTNPLYYIITILIIFLATGGALFMPRRRLHHFQAAMAGASVGADPDIAGTSRPITVTDDSSDSDHTASLIDSVNPANEAHEPGQVISPNAEDESGTSNASDDDSSDSNDSSDPPVALDPPEAEEPSPPAEETPEPEAPEEPETPEPSTEEPTAEEPAAEESTPPEPAESADTAPTLEPSESADTTETPEPAESADTAPPTTPEADPPEVSDDPPTSPDAPA